MKKFICTFLFLSTLFFTPRISFAQQPPAYHIPDSFVFDYEVVQQVTDQKNPGSPKNITYYYSQNGDYMALGNAEKSKNQFIIFTKEGVNIIIDEEKKNVTAMRLGNLIGDLGKAMATQKKNNPSQPAGDSNKMKSVKTGNTKQVCGYTAEEYTFTDNNGKTGSVWCAKVDFNASLFYLMGTNIGGANAGQPRMSKVPQASNYPSFSDPHLLLVETKSASHPDEGITTKSITKKTTTFNTKGYTINDYSNMNLQQMMQSKMNQN